MVRDYELMYIARPELDDEGLQGAVDSVDRLVTGAGGSVVRTTNWGRRRLAYEVDHLRDGHYMLLHLRMEGGRVADLERALAIHETVFRHLLVVREGGEDLEAENGAAVAVTAAGDGAAARQAVVASGGEDAAGGENGDDEEEEEDETPAALLVATEEEN
ncbi:MAG: 30S ribosomal protein S6 [Candidatus Dormibacteria bacterium]